MRCLLLALLAAASALAVHSAKTSRAELRLSRDQLSATRGGQASYCCRAHADCNLPSPLPPCSTPQGEETGNVRDICAARENVREPSDADDACQPAPDPYEDCSGEGGLVACWRVRECYFDTTSLSCLPQDEQNGGSNPTLVPLIRTPACFDTQPPAR